MGIKSTPNRVHLTGGNVKRRTKGFKFEKYVGTGSNYLMRAPPKEKKKEEDVSWPEKSATVGPHGVPPECQRKVQPINNPTSINALDLCPFCGRRSRVFTAALGRVQSTSYKL